MSIVLSSILGFSLLELVEHVILIGIGIALIASIISMTGLIINAIHIRKQSKVSSANLILNLLEPWRKNDFKNALSNMRKGNYNTDKVEEFLNQMEDIAIFWKDGTLTDNHVKEFFGENLKFIRDDEFIKKYMNTWTDKNPDYFFVNLTTLLKKIEKWKI